MALTPEEYNRLAANLRYRLGDNLDTVVQWYIENRSYSYMTEEYFKLTGETKNPSFWGNVRGMVYNQWLRGDW